MELVFWENQKLMKNLYGALISPVCQKYGLTRMELDILLFIANNPGFDTAKDMVDKRQLTKSHVSVSVKSLEGRGMVKKQFHKGNCKTEHLMLTESAQPVIKDGQCAQQEFFDVMLGDIPQEEARQAMAVLDRMFDNIRGYVRAKEL